MRQRIRLPWGQLVPPTKRPSPANIKVVRDIPVDAEQSDMQFKILGGVWIAIEEKHQDGSATVQYLSGTPDADEVRAQEFDELCSIAAGMFVLPADFELDS